ncbi:unnamed protein product, partial [Mesorhabditis spiculigera]
MADSRIVTGELFAMGRCPNWKPTPPRDRSTRCDQSKDELATELSQSYPAAKCACIQIVFAGTPQYQCHCGESGNCHGSDDYHHYHDNNYHNDHDDDNHYHDDRAHATPRDNDYQHDTGLYHDRNPGNGQCHCIMITITGPASAQYQCSCLSTPATPRMYRQAAEPPMTTQAAITYPPQTAIPDTLPPATQPSTPLTLDHTDHAATYYCCPDPCPRCNHYGARISSSRQHVLCIDWRSVIPVHMYARIRPMCTEYLLSQGQIQVAEAQQIGRLAANPPPNSLARRPVIHHRRS